MGQTYRLSREWLFVLVLSLLAFAVTAAALPWAGEDFEKFLGPLPPLLVVVAVAAAGAGALRLLREAGFAVLGANTREGVMVSALLATVLGIAIILADLAFRYPEDINTEMPRALLFYPAIGFVAEYLFHVIPLALLWLALRPFDVQLGPQRRVWLAIALIAVIEPTFQLGFVDDASAWEAAYTWVHVFAVAMCQLAVFKRYDFASMFALRLFYYAYWHLAWGALRLEVLF